MRYKNILFDLDGTITDPALGITNSVMYALEKYGIKVKERSELYKFIGPPLAGSFSEYFGFSKEEDVRAVEIFREYFSEKGLFENKVYPGIEKMLAKLKNSGAKIYLATSKPEVFAEQILEHFNLDKYFTAISGSELNGNRVEKEAVIEYVLKNYNIDNAVMVGDRSFDIIGAKKNGMDSVGVLYGYGTKEELAEAGADYIAENVEKLSDFLLN